jgi:hypothetical protein
VCLCLETNGERGGGGEEIEVEEGTERERTGETGSE